MKDIVGYEQNGEVFLWGEELRVTKSPIDWVGKRITLVLPPPGDTRARVRHSSGFFWVDEQWEFERWADPVFAPPPDILVTGPTTFDEVNPRHYKSHRSGIECIEIMERLGANLGTAFKYLWRADEKHETPIVDLKKALWYLRRELDFKWEPSATTEARLRRVVPHETFAVGSAMLAILEAADSETASVEKRIVILKAIEFAEMEMRRIAEEKE